MRMLPPKKSDMESTNHLKKPKAMSIWVHLQYRYLYLYLSVIPNVKILVSLGDPQVKSRFFSAFQGPWQHKNTVQPTGWVWLEDEDWKHCRGILR